MAVSVVTSGTQTATPGTEHTLHTTATAGVYALAVDTTNLAGTETVELRAYLKVISGGSYRQAHVVTVYTGDASPAAFSLPFISPVDIKFTLKQVGGSSRNFDWGVWTV